MDTEEEHLCTEWRHWEKGYRGGRGSLGVLGILLEVGKQTLCQACCLFPPYCVKLLKHLDLEYLLRFLVLEFGVLNIFQWIFTKFKEKIFKWLYWFDLPFYLHFS